jgi:hypothetical protein
MVPDTTSPVVMMVTVVSPGAGGVHGSIYL